MPHLHSSSASEGQIRCFGSFLSSLGLSTTSTRLERMSPPSIYELCRPRADVLEGRIRDEDFAADLSQVLKGTAPELY